MIRFGNGWSDDCGPDDCYNPIQFTKSVLTRNDERSCDVCPELGGCCGTGRKDGSRMACEGGLKRDRNGGRSVSNVTRK